jgi:hypothetical protein
LLWSIMVFAADPAQHIINLRLLHHGCAAGSLWRFQHACQLISLRSSSRSTARVLLEGTLLGLSCPNLVSSTPSAGWRHSGNSELLRRDFMRKSADYRTQVHGAARNAS